MNRNKYIIERRNIIKKKKSDQLIIIIYFERYLKIQVKHKQNKTKLNEYNI